VEVHKDKQLVGFPSTHLICTGRKKDIICIGLVVELLLFDLLLFFHAGVDASADCVEIQSFCCFCLCVSRFVLGFICFVAFLVLLWLCAHCSGFFVAFE